MISAAQIHAHFETDLEDAAIEMLIADAYAAITARYGDTEAIVVELRGGYPLVTLPRAIKKDDAGDWMIDTIVEVNPFTSVLTTLSANDYAVRLRGLALDRMSNGTNQAYTWAPTTIVSYTPVDDNRDRVVIDLVKLAIQYQGLQRERGGDYEAYFNDYQAERDKLISQVGRGALRFA